MKPYKVAIIGQGFVGKSFKRLFERHYEVVTYDPSQNENYPATEIDKCDLSVICVPTPMSADGSCDTSIVEKMVKKVRTPLILIKSTVVPGMTDKLRERTGKKICFSPEYTGESVYFQPPEYDWREIEQEPFVIVGGNARANSFL